MECDTREVLPRARVMLGRGDQLGGDYVRDDHVTNAYGHSIVSRKHDRFVRRPTAGNTIHYAKGVGTDRVRIELVASADNRPLKHPLSCGRSFIGLLTRSFGPDEVLTGCGSGGNCG